MAEAPRSKRARRTKALELWLRGRGVDQEEAVREACLYASTIDELATAPPEDMTWLTEAWDAGVRETFLEAVKSARDAIDRGETPPGADEQGQDPSYHPSQEYATLGGGGGSVADDAAADMLSTLAEGAEQAPAAPTAPAAPPPPAKAPAPKGGAPRFRMSILTDYAGVVSETVTDERLPPIVEGQAPDDANLEFRTLLNFEKVGRGEAKRCVMCGRVSEYEDRRKAGCEPQTCVIPKQCKDVCDACTKSTWHHRATGVYFKWCQGCKKFRSVVAFANKRHTAKCDPCRKRGRDGYHTKVKKKKADDAAPEPAPPLADLAGLVPAVPPPAPVSLAPVDAEPGAVLPPPATL